MCRTIQINGKQHYRCRAVDQDGEVVDVFSQTKRDGAAARRFFRRLLQSYKGEPWKIVTDKLLSYAVAHRELISDAIHDKSQYANSRAEQSHALTRVRERGMRGPASRGFQSVSVLMSDIPHKLDAGNARNYQQNGKYCNKHW